MNIAIVQLGTTIELLQTAITILSFTKEYKDKDVVIICFEETYNDIEFLFKIFNLKVSLIKKKLLTNKKDHLANILNFLDSSLSKINLKTYDELYNLSYNEQSSLLSSLIESKRKFGLHTNLKNEIVINNRLSQLSYAILSEKLVSSSSLINFHNYLLDTVPSFSNEHKIFNLSKALIDLRFIKDNTIINSVLELLSKFSSQNVFSVITTKKSHFNYKNLQFVSPDLSLDDYFSMLINSTFFIGDLSFLSKLTSITHTKSLCFYSDEVSPMFNFPYQNNVELIHENLIYETFNYLSTDKNLLNFNKKYFSFKTHYIDSLGIFLKPSNESFEMPYNYILSCFYNVVWTYYLFEVEFPSPYLNFSPSLIEKFNNLDITLAKAYELLHFGATFSKRIIDDTKIELHKLIISDSIKKVQETIGLIKTLSSTSDELKPLLEYIIVRALNALGENVKEVSEEHLLIFNEGKILIEVFRELIRNTLDNLSKIRKNIEIQEV